MPTTMSVAAAGVPTVKIEPFSELKFKNIVHQAYDYSCGSAALVTILKYHLGLEVTETAIVPDGSAGERAREELQMLHDRGVHIAIDDFGTGHSSLAYLKRFPVDHLKIDRSFIADIPADRGAAAITQAIIAMAHSLELKVIAEGVETEAQYQFLLAQRCDGYQGYFFSKPIPAEQMRALLEDAAARALTVIAR